ncbi:MAG: hypothetical protein IJ829_00725 [Kiritimatiellae bacterium]|nr:hypothetical protein [Kiritimatiellia bacterium]
MDADIERSSLRSGLRTLLAAVAVLACARASAGERVDFSFRPLLAGRASLTETGYVERRVLGVARWIE